MRKDATRCCYVLPPDMKACIDLCRLLHVELRLGARDCQLSARAHRLPREFVYRSSPETYRYQRSIHIPTASTRLYQSQGSQALIHVHLVIYMVLKCQIPRASM